MSNFHYTISSDGRTDGQTGKRAGKSTDSQPSQRAFKLSMQTDKNHKHICDNNNGIYVDNDY